MSGTIPAAPPSLSAGVSPAPSRSNRKGSKSGGSSSREGPADSGSKSARREADEAARSAAPLEPASRDQNSSVAASLSFASWLSGGEPLPSSTAGREAAALRAGTQHAARGAVSHTRRTSWLSAWFLPAAPHRPSSRAALRPPSTSASASIRAPSLFSVLLRPSSLFLGSLILLVALLLPLLPLPSLPAVSPPSSPLSAAMWRLLGWSAKAGSPEAVAAAAMAAVQQQAADVEQLRALVVRLEQRSSTVTQALQAQSDSLAHDVAALRQQQQQLQHSASLATQRLGEQLEALGLRVAAMDSAVLQVVQQAGERVREEVLAQARELVRAQLSGARVRPLSLSDVRSAARRVVTEELRRHSADDLAMPDHAIGSAGGRVTAHSRAVYLPGQLASARAQLLPALLLRLLGGAFGLPQGARGVEGGAAQGGANESSGRAECVRGKGECEGIAGGEAMEGTPAAAAARASVAEGVREGSHRSAGPTGGSASTAPPLPPPVRPVLVLHPHAQRVVTPGLVPGNCLPLQGSRGFVEIQLRAAVRLAAVAVEHLPQSLAYDISSAPKDFQVFGRLSSPAEDASTSAPSPSPSPSPPSSAWSLLLPSCQYRIGSPHPPIQLFRIAGAAWSGLDAAGHAGEEPSDINQEQPPPQGFPGTDPLGFAAEEGAEAEEAESAPSAAAGATPASPPSSSSPLPVVDALRVVLLSNHGHPNFTCLYRVRALGHEGGAVGVLE